MLRFMLGELSQERKRSWELAESVLSARNERDCYVASYQNGNRIIGDRNAELQREQTLVENAVGRANQADKRAFEAQQQVAALTAERDRLRTGLEKIRDYEPESATDPYWDIATFTKGIARAALEKKADGLRSLT